MGGLENVSEILIRVYKDILLTVQAQNVRFAAFSGLVLCTSAGTIHFISVLPCKTQSSHSVTAIIYPSGMLSS